MKMKLSMIINYISLKFSFIFIDTSLYCNSNISGKYKLEYNNSAISFDMVTKTMHLYLRSYVFVRELCVWMPVFASKLDMRYNLLQQKEAFTTMTHIYLIIISTNASHKKVFSDSSQLFYLLIFLFTENKEHTFSTKRISYQEKFGRISMKIKFALSIFCFNA